MMRIALVPQTCDATVQILEYYVCFFFLGNLTCRSDYTLIGSSCYHYRRQMVKFDDHVMFCANKGGQLAKIDSADENTKIANILSGNTTFLVVLLLLL